MKSVSMLSSLLAQNQQDPVQTYEHLANLGRLPKPPDFKFAHEPPVWKCHLRVPVECGQEKQAVYTLVETLGSGRNQKTAKRKAFADALDTIRQLCHDQLHQLCDTTFQVRQKELNSVQLGPRSPTVDPSQSEAAVIAAAQPHLTTLTESARALVTLRAMVLDVEKYERGQELLEIGWVEVDGSGRTVCAHHYVVAEHMHLVNRDYCESNPGSFAYGQSEYLPLSAVLQALQCALAHVDLLVGHSLETSDLPWLRALGVSFASGSLIVDVDKVEKAVRKTHKSTSLCRLVDSVYSVTTYGPAHNAGNDAVATAQVWGQQLQEHTSSSVDWVVDALRTVGRPPSSAPAVVSIGRVTGSTCGSDQEQSQASGSLGSNTSLVDDKPWCPYDDIGLDVMLAQWFDALLV